MLLARRLVEYFHQTSINPFDPAAAQLLSQDATSQALIAEIGRRTPSADPALSLVLLLQSLKIEASESQGTEAQAECVATLPQAYSLPTRPTRIVIREMMTAARRTVLAAGYVITDSSDLLPLAKAAARRNVGVTLVCDQGQDDARRIQATWPSDIPLPRLLVNVLPDDPLGKMHAKVLIVDNENLLATSANFTLHGQQVNIEYGLRISGGPARQSTQFFKALEQLGVLVPYV